VAERTTNQDNGLWSHKTRGPATEGCEDCKCYDTGADARCTIPTEPEKVASSW